MGNVGKCWEIYGTCWGIHGKCWEIHGKCWEIHGKSRDSSWKEFGNICEGSFDLAFVAWVSMHWSLQPNLRDHLMNHLIDLLVHMAYGFQQESFKIKCMNLRVLFNQLVIMFIPQRFVSWIVNVSISRCSDHPNRSLDSLNRRTADCNMDVYENEAPTQPTPMLLAFLLN